MANPIVLDLPDDISQRIAEIAESTGHPIERVLIDHLKTLTKPAPSLSDEINAELEALPHLSDDALWTIAREQMPDVAQKRAHELLAQQARNQLPVAEKAELEHLIERGDRLALRKAEAAALLIKRGYTFTKQDYLRLDVPLSNA